MEYPEQALEAAPLQGGWAFAELSQLFVAALAFKTRSFTPSNPMVI